MEKGKMKCFQPRGMNSPTTFFFLLDEATRSCWDPYVGAKKGWGVLVGQACGREAALSPGPAEQQPKPAAAANLPQEYSWIRALAMLREYVQGEKNEGFQTLTLMLLLGILAA